MPSESTLWHMKKSCPVVLCVIAAVALSAPAQDTVYDLVKRSVAVIEAGSMAGSGFKETCQSTWFENPRQFSKNLALIGNMMKSVEAQDSINTSLFKVYLVAVIG